METQSSEGLVKKKKKKDEASMMREWFFTLAPLQIAILEEHLLQCFTDEEVNTVKESCYGRFALYREIHIVFRITFRKSQKWQQANG